MNKDEANARAEHAKQLLTDSLLKESFDNAEALLNQAVRSAKSPEEAFKAAIACQVFELLRGALQTHIETAKVIEFNTKKSFVDKVLGR